MSLEKDEKKILEKENKEIIKLLNEANAKVNQANEIMKKQKKRLRKK